MVLQTSGQITLADVQSEFGGGAPININEYYRGGTYVPDTAANSNIPTSGQISLSNFYGGDSTPGSSLTEDPYYELTQLRTMSGQSSTWTTYTDSLSSYAGQKGRLVFIYQNGTSFRGDIQVDDINFDGNSYSFESDTHGWLTSSSSTNTADFTNFEKFQNNISTWPTMGSSGSQRRWNRDSGGTPSSSTGLTSADDGSYYIYTEVSGTGSGAFFTACSPLLQLSSNPGNLSYAVARYGVNIGTFRVYWAKNTTVDPYPQTVFTNVTRLLQDTGPGFGSYWVDGNQGTTVYNTYGNWPSGPSNGDTARVVIAYVSGTSFTGDLQFDDFYVNATSSTAGGTSTNIDFTGSDWEQYGTLFSSSFPPSGSSVLSAVNSSGWSSISAGTSQSFWNIDSGGTPSSSTGVTTVGFNNYIYFETSGSGYSYKCRLLKSPEFTINKSSSSYGVRTKMAAYGATIGECEFWLVYT